MIRFIEALLCGMQVSQASGSYALAPGTYSGSSNGSFALTPTA